MNLTMMSTKLLRNMVTKRHTTTPCVWALALQQLHQCLKSKLNISMVESAAMYQPFQSFHCQHKIINNLLPRAVSSHVELTRHYHSLTCGHQWSSIKHNSQVRHKQQKKKKGYESDSSGSDDSDDEDDGPFTEDDFKAPQNFKKMKVTVTSLRADTIISNALNVSRNKLDEIFLSSSMLLNGSKLTKKAAVIDEGDYIDIIMEKLEDKVKVKRAKVLKVSQEKTQKGKLTVTLRVWKKPFLTDSPRFHSMKS